MGSISEWRGIAHLDRFGCWWFEWSAWGSLGLSTGHMAHTLRVVLVVVAVWLVGEMVTVTDN